MATSTKTKQETRSGIDSKTVRKVIAMRASGKTWAEICAIYKQPLRWQVTIRPYMKEVAPDSVAPLGPGSANYGKKNGAKSTKKSKATTRKRSTRKARSR
ncbi:MAG: hypothetical protein ACRDIW_01000 [Actinomycetota bacterium]